MIVRPGLVYPSGIPATRTDYDCEVGSLLTRESRELLKSIVSNALSPFVKKEGLISQKSFTFAKDYDIIYIYSKLIRS